MQTMMDHVVKVNKYLSALWYATKGFKRMHHHIIHYNYTSFHASMLIRFQHSLLQSVNCLILFNKASHIHNLCRSYCCYGFLNKDFKDCFTQIIFLFSYLLHSLTMLKKYCASICAHILIIHQQHLQHDVNHITSIKR